MHPAATDIPQPLPEITSRLKWLWFKDDRFLIDFQTFDEASRGLQGSLKMMFKLQWRIMASLLVLTYTLGAILPPITQKTISYPTRFVTSGDIANTNAAKYLSVKRVPYAENITWNIWDIDADVQADGWNATLPLPGAYLTSPVAYNLKIIPMMKSLVFPDDRNLNLSTIFRMSLIYSKGPDLPYPLFSNWTKAPSFNAVEVSFYQCVKELEVRVEKGVPHTTELGSWYEVIDSKNISIWNYQCYMDAASGYWNAGPGCYLDYPDYFYTVQVANTSNATTGIEAPENVVNTSISAMSLFASAYIEGMIGKFGWTGPTGLGNYYEGGPAVLRYLKDLSFDHNITHSEILKNIQDTAENLARTGTNSLRTMPRINGTQASYLVPGTAFVEESYVQIRWGWLSFLAATIIIVSLLILFTIWFTAAKNGKTLKTSTLASLVALDTDCSSRFGGIGAKHDMENKARHINVRLVGDHLVGSDGDPSLQV
ncbi:hypothetical protein GGR58DRAFT_519868 [Xylaria digitata]|nr:hypothetical protein GGR58DRAFT_519868 [Xylaria digitata]